MGLSPTSTAASLAAPFPGLGLAQRRFFSVEELNAAIGPLLEKLNGSRMRRYDKSRRALFEEQERAALRALPAEPYAWGTWLKRSLGNDYHVQLDYNFYSAPCRYSGQEVGVRVGERMVEIFLLDRSQRIAAHPLQRGRNQFATEPGHMPENHRKTRKLRDRDYGSWLLVEARKIGPAAVAWTERNFASADFPEQRYRTVRGMLGLADRHSPERVNGACRRGLAVARLGSGFLRARLKENPEDRAVGEAGTAEPAPFPFTTRRRPPKHPLQTDEPFKCHKNLGQVCLNSANFPRLDLRIQGRANQLHDSKGITVRLTAICACPLST